MGNIVFMYAFMEFLYTVLFRGWQKETALHWTRKRRWVRYCKCKRSWVTYELYVVLLIQQEVFYLQIPVRQRQKEDVNAYTVSLFTFDNLSKPQSSYNAQAEEVNPPASPNTYTYTPPNVGHAGWFSEPIVCLLSFRNPVIQLSTWAISPCRDI